MPTKTPVAKKPVKASAKAKKEGSTAATAPAGAAARTRKSVKVSSGTMSAACVACEISAPDEKAFWVNNGPVISTLDGLRAALESMSDEQFDYHTKRSGNDFAKWVDEVLCHGACAKKLATAKTRTGAVRAITVCQCA